MRRVDGQIWIDKNDPHRLKYHFDGIDYTVEVAASYYPGSASKLLPAGTIVKLIPGTKNAIAPAVYPDDLNGILGITLTKSMQGDEDIGRVAVSQTGYMVLPNAEEVKSAFPITTDFNVNTNGWKDDGESHNGIGAPIYWFIGGTFRTLGPEGDPVYNYIDSSKHPGKITLRTPSGYKWNITEVEDSSMNIGYDNLPIIGSVAEYDYDMDGNITRMFIHLNFSKFDSSVEWNWPYLHDNSVETYSLKSLQGHCGKLTEGSPRPFYHGLFADNNYYSELSSFVNIMATYDTNIGANVTINADNTNIITGPDRRTEITINTPEDNLLYRISGEVHYKFDKEPEGE